MPDGHNTHHTPSARPGMKQPDTAHTLKKRLLVSALVLFIGLIAGCNGPEIDASSDQSLQFSIEHIRSTLDTENRAAFDAALIHLNDLLFHNTDAVSQATISLYRPESLLRKILHAKTAREVIVMVKKHRQKQGAE